MPYTATTWVNNQAPALSAANLNKLTDELEDQANDSGANIPLLPTWVDDAAPALTDAAPLNLLEQATLAIATELGLSYTPTVWEEGWTPARNATRFNKLELAAQAARVAIEAQVEPPTGEPLVSNRVSLATNSIAYWLFHNSPTTQIIGTDGNGDRQRCIVWNTAGGQSTARYSARLMYALAGFRLVSGFPGVICNWHTQPNDQPHGYSPLCKAGGAPHADSPIRIEYFNNGAGLIVNTEADAGSCNGSGRKKHTIFTPTEAEARRGDWLWIWMEAGLDRSDEAPTGNGHLKVWVADEDPSSPRIDESNLQMHWYQQHQCTYWQGAYVSTGSGNVVIEHAATRFGRTPQECYEDTSIVLSRAGNAGGTGGAHVSIAPRLSTEAAIPSALDWT